MQINRDLYVCVHSCSAEVAPNCMSLPQSVEELLPTMVAVDTVNAHFAGRPSGEGKLAGQLEQLAAAWGLKTRRYLVDGDAFNLLVYHERPHRSEERRVGEEGR